MKYFNNGCHTLIFCYYFGMKSENIYVKNFAPKIFSFIAKYYPTEIIAPYIFIGTSGYVAKIN